MRDETKRYLMERREKRRARHLEDVESSLQKLSIIPIPAKERIRQRRISRLRRNAL